MARLPLIVQSERRKRIGLAITLWLQMCTVASWFLVAFGANHSLHIYRPKIRSYILDFYAKRDYVKRLVYASDETCIEQVRMNRPTFSKKKKKISDASDSSTSFHDAVTLLAETIRTVGLEISKSIASEVLIQQKSKMTIQKSALKLYSTLCEVEGLTEDERYRALSKIPDHSTQMLIFFSLPSSVRLEWVRRFLADH
ncbi:hypothetical protein J1N35_024451 [Gossypium stocksii]|uniref:Uncharacterized protein n=1 Tax=Gossypium stocksii TaxID=47602 RepID=A0A9D3ZXD4_9ROSI|nr:hypothetical protein J1N35_024451 [Gossypium stocksii]